MKKDIIETLLVAGSALKRVQGDFSFRETMAVIVDGAMKYPLMFSIETKSTNGII